MNLIKLCCSRSCNKSGLIKNVKFYSSTSVEVKEEKLAKKTSLFDFHVKKGGKIVDFANYLLPVQYTDQGIAASHIHTRALGCASIFDVSHMLQTHVTGRDAVECFETICTADIHGLAKRSGALTVFTNENGGILDDLIVTKVNDRFLYVVSNAARKEHDSGLMSEAVERFRGKGKEVDVKFFDPMEKALLAFQGPAAAKVLQEMTKVNLSELYFMNTADADINGIPDCRITRCGYTGEDGFEISIPADKATQVAEALLESKLGNIKLAGLGARDSLRLEAGLCLYGSDIDESTTPIEAALAWLVAKRRRAEGDFPGAQRIMKQLRDGCEKRRVGIKSSGPPARHGIQIYSNNVEIGEITSGCPSPSLGGNVAMGYIAESFKKVNTKVDLKIRDKFHATEISKMPFIPANYYHKPKP